MRMIDADMLADGLKLHRQSTDQKHETDRQWAVGYNAGLERALYSISYAPTLTPPNEWVSVDNKLPKNGVPVLIGNPHWDYPVVANYAGHGVWMDSWKQKMTFTPTHWMLLPAPPDRRPPEGET